jgi:hypothetical protein
MVSASAIDALVVYRCIDCLAIALSGLLEAGFEASKSSFSAEDLIER